MTIHRKRELSPLTDPATGTALPRREQPGYYPGFRTLSQQAYWDRTTRELIRQRVEEQRPIRFFSPQEAATMTAVCERVLPQDDRVSERRIPILPELDARLFENRIDGYRYEDMPSDQQAYCIAASAFDVMARELHGRRFVACTVPEQERMILSIHDGAPLGAKKLWAQMNVERFWAMLVSDCAGAYYAHPWAWDEIGFGGPSYPRGYMRLTEGEPEPWEVDEQRYAWTAPAETISDTAKSHGSGQQHQTYPGQGGTH